MEESRVFETHTFYKVRADFQSTQVPNWFTLHWRNTEDFNPTHIVQSDFESVPARLSGLCSIYWRMMWVLPPQWFFRPRLFSKQIRLTNYSSTIHKWEEGEGFEPPEVFMPLRFSRPTH